MARAAELARLELEGGGDGGGGGGELVGLEVDAGEDEVGVDVGGDFERGAGFGAGVVRGAAAFADLSEAGVGGGVVGVGGESGVELLLSFGDKALREVLQAELGVLSCLLRGRERGHLNGAHLVKLEGDLAEGGFGPGAANARGGIEAAGADD